LVQEDDQGEKVCDKKHQRYNNNNNNNNNNNVIFRNDRDSM